MLGGPDTNEAVPHWVEDVRLGTCESMPTPLNWDDANYFVYLVNGYTAMDPDKLGSFANSRLKKATKTGIWTGDVRDLWLCLFYEKRRWRHFGVEPDGEALVILNGLCKSLRSKLAALDVAGRSSLVALMGEHPCPWSQGTLR
jgi:hypothetical protein